MDLLGQYDKENSFSDSDTSIKESFTDADKFAESRKSSDLALDPVSHESEVDKCDFFGFESSDSDEIDEAVAKARNASAEIKEKYRKKNSLSISLSVTKEPSKKITQSEGRPHSDLPTSEFWTSKSTSICWDNPKRIWCVENKSSTVVKKSYVPSHTNHYEENVVPSKRLKQDQTTVTTDEPQKLRNSCFKVHRRIAPYIDNLSHSRLPKQSYCLLGHSGAVNKIEWCCSQYSHLLISCGMDTTVKLWDVFSSSKDCIQLFSHHSKAVKDVVWSKDGKNILSCGYDKNVRLFDIEKGCEVACSSFTSYLSSVCYHPVNYHVFVCGSQDCLLLGDSRMKDSLVKKYIYKQKFGQVQDIMFNAEGNEFFCCTDHVSKESADRSIMAWDFSTGVVLSNQIYQERYTCTRLRRHPSERTLAAQTNGDYIALFSTIRPYKMHKTKRFEGHKVHGYKVGCDISRDGTVVVSGSADGNVYFYDYRTSTQIKKTELSNEVCLDVTWHPVLNSTIAVSTWSGSIYVLH